MSLISRLSTSMCFLKCLTKDMFSCQTISYNNLRIVFCELSHFDLLVASRILRRCKWGGVRNRLDHCSKEMKQVQHMEVHEVPRYLQLLTGFWWVSLGALLDPERGPANPPNLFCLHFHVHTARKHGSHAWHRSFASVFVTKLDVLHLNLHSPILMDCATASAMKSS